MSEAPDAFDTEFEATRDAERGEHIEVEADSADDTGAREADEAAEVEEKTPDVLRAEAAEKRLQDTQKAMKAERRKRQELEKRFEAFEKATKPGDAPLDPAALLAKLRDDDEDPIGDIATVKQLAKLLVGQTQEESAADKATREYQAALNTVASTMKEYEDDFKELHPDYPKAAAHFMDARAAELKDEGVEGAALTTQLQKDMAGIVARSVAAGKDPAEVIYNMAQRRGFKLPGASEKLDTIAKGQEQSKTLSGGKTNDVTLTAGKVADLKGAAFDAAFEKLRAAERRR